MKEMSSGQVTHIPSASLFSCSASLNKINCVWVFEGSHFLDWITASLACKQNMTAIQGNESTTVRLDDYLI